MTIKGILTDSGGVLNGPISGHWMLPPNFFSVVDKKAFSEISKKRKRHAFKKAMMYIESIPHMITMDEEYHHFMKHYQILFDNLPDIKIDTEGVEALTKDLVYNMQKYRFYDDAVTIIPDLAGKYKMAIVSDAWPSLRSIFNHNDFEKHFRSFVVSCEMGTTKPDSRMYLEAVNQLGLRCDEVVFIDDRIKNCNGANDAGISLTYLMCRSSLEYLYRRITIRNHIVVKDFKQLKKDLEKRC